MNFCDFIFKQFVCLASVAMCLGVASAGKPSTKYLPPNFAAVGQAAASSQYPHYHGVSGVAAAPAVAPVHASAQYAHNRAAAQIPILRNDYNNDGSGNYNFR